MKLSDARACRVGELLLEQENTNDVNVTDSNGPCEMRRRAAVSASSRCAAIDAYRSARDLNVERRRNNG